jgi:hypothetical protein
LVGFSIHVLIQIQQSKISICGIVQWVK